ncbi:glycosyltransferase [Oscillatoria amoena NRMC-F 0135]|nr:glycosyltransferase [Oscillatoria amoena NRMC-F 0135]
MSQYPLSIIICTYNPRREILARTLQHLREQKLDEGPSFEVLIVDNNSAPPSPEGGVEP